MPRQPSTIKPMLATLTKEPFASGDWLYEIKWDGYRIIAHIEKGKVTLRSREGLDYTNKYKLIANELEGQGDMVLDGEVVVLNDDGKPDFSALQNYQGQGDIAFYVFDLLWYEGESWMNRALIERKEMLLHVVKQVEFLTYSDHFEDGLHLFEQMKVMKMEGVMAKRKESLYYPGQRTKDWLKVKISKRREYVIGGWTEADSKKTFRSILFGEYVDGKLRYVHHSGGGYTDKQKRELFAKMSSLEIKKSPFTNIQDITVDRPCHWVKPELVAEIEISDKFTNAGIIRHPAIYKGLRADKPAKQVVPDVYHAVMAEIKRAREKRLKT